MATYRERVAQKLIQILAAQLSLGPAEISGGSQLREDLDADSLDAISIVMDIEDTYLIEIQDAEWEPVRTVDQAVDLVVAKIDQASRAAAGPS